MAKGHMIMTKKSSSTGWPLNNTSSTCAAGIRMGLHPNTCASHSFRQPESLVAHVQFPAIV